MVETKFWVERDSGIVDGCTFVVQWGDLWGVAIPLYLALVVGGTVAAFKLFNAGHRPWALLVSGVGITLALSLVGGPHCHAESAALETTYWSNWVLLAFCILCGGFLHAFRDSALRPGGWASALIYRKVASPRTSDFFRKDLVFLGPLNEILSMTWGECVVWTAVVAWLVVAAVDKYNNLTADPPTMNSGLETALGNKTRALGKAFAQISIRCVFLSVISPTRNVVLYQMFGIPFERGIKAHKQAGRLMVVAGWLHVICMLAGGTERTGVKWTNTVDMTSPNPIFGPFALAAWTAMLLLSLPYFRRHKFEHFYVIHLNLWFVGNVMTVLHNRQNAVVWIIAGVLTLWLDFAVRWYAKLARKSTLVDFDVVAENLVKMVVKRDGAWPGGAFDFHPGSYIWLSVDVPAEKRAAYMREVDVKPVIPVPIPSFVWFHPITVSSFDPASGELTLFIKRMGEGEEQWSGQIIATLKAVRDGKDLSKEDVRVHIGGPNGSLQVNPDWMDHCVLVSGGDRRHPHGGDSRRSRAQGPARRIRRPRAQKQDHVRVDHPRGRGDRRVQVSLRRRRRARAEGARVVRRSRLLHRSLRPGRRVGGARPLRRRRLPGTTGRRRDPRGRGGRGREDGRVRVRPGSAQRRRRGGRHRRGVPRAPRDVRVLSFRSILHDDVDAL